MSPHHTHSDKHEAHRQLGARLRQQSGDVARITSGLDEASLAKRTNPEQWSLKELVCHLHRVQQIFEARVDAMLAQDNPPIASYMPDGDAEFEKMVTRPARDCIIAFLEDRERLALRLAELSPAEWHRTGKHPDFPHYDVHFQIEYMVHHEGHHIYQMYQRRVPFGKMPH
jgi:hypothetical protein